ncbi:MAG: hypothetical protein LBM00_07700 [Deltaproteobacteria bacterium]|jgi:hypothetical protein|nr:hypothetical protein [Deltaproteobacteria bacterium]
MPATIPSCPKAIPLMPVRYAIADETLEAKVDSAKKSPTPEELPALSRFRYIKRLLRPGGYLYVYLEKIGCFEVMVKDGGILENKDAMLCPGTRLIRDGRFLNVPEGDPVMLAYSEEKWPEETVALVKSKNGAEFRKKRMVTCATDHKHTIALNLFDKEIEEYKPQDGALTLKRLCEQYEEENYVAECKSYLELSEILQREGECNYLPEPTGSKPENLSPLRWSITEFAPQDDHEKIRKICANEPKALIGIVTDITGVTEEIAKLHSLAFSDKQSFEVFHKYPLAISETIDILLRAKKGSIRHIRSRERMNFNNKYSKDEAGIGKFFKAIAEDWNSCLSGKYESQGGNVVGSFDEVMKDYSRTKNGTYLNYREAIFARCIATIGCSEPAREVFDKLYAQNLPSLENWYWKVLVSESNITPLQWRNDAAVVQEIFNRKTTKWTVAILEATEHLFYNISDEDVLFFISSVAARDKVVLSRKYLGGKERHQALKAIVNQYDALAQDSGAADKSGTGELDAEELKYKKELEQKKADIVEQVQKIKKEMLSLPLGKRLEGAKLTTPELNFEDAESEAAAKVLMSFVYSLEIASDKSKSGVPLCLKPLVGLSMLYNAGQYARAIASDPSSCRNILLSGVVCLSTTAAFFKGGEIADDLYQTMLKQRENQLAKLISKLAEFDEKIMNVEQKLLRSRYVEQRNTIVKLLETSRPDLVKNVRMLAEASEENAFRAAAESIFRRSDLAFGDKLALNKIGRLAEYPAGLDVSGAIEKLGTRANVSMGLATVLMGVIDIVDAFTNDKDDFYGRSILAARGVTTSALGAGTILRALKSTGLARFFTCLAFLAEGSVLIALTIAVLIFDGLYWYFKGRDFDFWMKTCLWGEEFKGGPVLQLCDRYVRGKIDATWRMNFECEEAQAALLTPYTSVVKGEKTAYSRPEYQSISSYPKVVFKFPGVNSESVLYYQFLNENTSVISKKEFIYRDNPELSIDDNGIATLSFTLENVPESTTTIRWIYLYNGHWYLPLSKDGAAEGRADISQRWNYSPV